MAKDRLSGNPILMYAQVKQFIEASNRLHSRETGGTAALPYFVLATFLVELLLKTAKSLPDSEFLKTHKLRDLFEDLDPDDQDLVLAHHRRLAREEYRGNRDPDEVFQQALDENSDGFVAMRYFFDQSPDAPEEMQWATDPGILAESVRRMLLDKHPQLARIRTELVYRVEPLP